MQEEIRMNIPNEIDKPPQFLGKDVDEVAVISIVVALGFLSGMIFSSCVIAYFISKLYAKFRQNQQENFLLHWLFWVGLYVPKARSIHHPYARRMR